MQKLFLTFFYTGLAPKAPGTVGTIGGLLAAWLILMYMPIDTLFMGTILLTLVAVREINKYEQNGGIHDDKSIVIDEVAGIWLALVIASAIPTLYQFVFSFVFFRLFDIWKPSIIGRSDRNVKGGWGVMGDDLLAGAFAGLCSAATFQLLVKLGIA
mgnify:CR=1 FL=1